MTARILLIRHGQSTWNAEGRWQGTEDPPLSTLGVRQARQASTALGSFDLVAASHLERASVTATIIADELGIGPVVTEPDLAERYAGEFQGLTRAEIEQRFPGYLAEGRKPPSYEPEDSVIERVVPALARIAAQVGDDGTALVVSHGGVVYALEALTAASREGRLPNLGGRWFEIGPSVLHAGESVLLVDADAVTVPNQI